MAKFELRDVRKSYGEIEVMHGVDVDVADGEFLVIVGPSGCGKSTLLRMVAGLEAITAGEIVIGDRVVNTLEPKERDIAMVFQNYALYPHMSVFDNMAYGLKIRGFAKADIEARVEAAAEILELGPLLERKPRAAFGRPAPARGDGPRHRARARGVPVRRAAVEPRRQAARADARRDPEAAPAARHDQPLRHARPGRGDDARASDGRDERRPAEQIGTPMEVYEHPATVFVAGFIGSPAMNFLEGKGERRRRPSRQRRRSAAGWPPAGGHHRRATRTPGALRAQRRQPGGSVEMVEALGADTLVHVAVAGHTIIARLPQARRPSRRADRAGRRPRSRLPIRRRDRRAAPS